MVYLDIVSGILMYLCHIDEDPEAEKAELEALETKFQPLIDYLKKSAEDVVKNGAQSPFHPLQHKADHRDYTS